MLISFSRDKKTIFCTFIICIKLFLLNVNFIIKPCWIVKHLIHSVTFFDQISGAVVVKIDATKTTYLNKKKGKIKIRFLIRQFITIKSQTIIIFKLKETWVIVNVCHSQLNICSNSLICQCNSLKCKWKFKELLLTIEKMTNRFLLNFKISYRIFNWLGNGIN